MITVTKVSDLTYPTKCYGCGKRNEGIRIEVSNPSRTRGEVLYICDECRRELKEKI